MIAHECGHQAFSPYQAVNDGVGLVLHSCLLVPYYSWKHSHRRHHSNTGSLAKDEVRAGGGWRWEGEKVGVWVGGWGGCTPHRLLSTARGPRLAASGPVAGTASPARQRAPAAGRRRPRGS